MDALAFLTATLSPFAPMLGRSGLSPLTTEFRSRRYLGLAIANFGHTFHERCPTETDRGAARRSRIEAPGRRTA